MYSIYVITNTVNGKQYVGYTSRSVNKRWWGHIDDSKREYSSMFGNPLQADIRKYGKDCFVHRVLVTTEDKELAMQLEDEMTITLNTHVPNGYNRQVGNHCEHTEDSKRKLSESLSGENNPNYGKHFSEEVRKKMSENHWDSSGANNPRARKCVCVETGQTFDTIKEASRWAGLKSTTCVRECCAGKRKTAGGYHWMYYEDYLEQNKEK